METYSLEVETSRQIDEQIESCLDCSIDADKRRPKEGASMVRGCEIGNRKWRDEAGGEDGDADEDVGWPAVAYHSTRVLDFD